MPASDPSSIQVRQTAANGLAQPLAGAATQLAMAFAILCGLVSLAFVRSPFDGNGDTAWLMHAAARWLDGQALYSEVFETNPPMAVLIYAPPMWLARTFGGAAQLWTHGFISALCLVSLWSVSRLAPMAGVRHRAVRLALLGGLAFALLIMPSRMFAQREHIAAALLLIYLMASAAVARGRTPSPTLSALAAIAGATALAIKPHFLLVAGLAHLALLAQALLRTRASHRLPADAKGWIGLVWRGGGAGWHAPTLAALLIGYVGLTWALARVYFTDMYPMLALVYVPHRLMSLPAMLTSPHGAAFLLAAALTVHLAFRARASLIIAQPPALVALFAAGVGGFVAFLVQGKGFPYHLIPGVAPLAGAAALALALAAHRLAGPGAAAVSALLALAFAVVTPLTLDQHHRPRALEAELRRLGDNRSIMIAAGDLGYAWPLVTRLGWTWTSRSMGMLIGNVAAARLETTRDPAEIAPLKREIEADIGRFVDDALASRPDVLAFRSDDPERLPTWTRADARFNAFLQGYAQVAYADGVIVLARPEVKRPERAPSPD
jgi:hypothetical protein